MSDDPAFTPLKPEHSYALIPPNLFNLRIVSHPATRSFLDMVARPANQCPAEGYTCFPRCYVYEACHVMDPALEWAPESVADYGIAETIKPVIQEVIRGNHQARLPRSPLPTAVIAKAGADNHGHVLTDILPKLVNVGRTGWGAVRLLLPEAMRRFGRLATDVLAHLGVRSELEFVARATLHEAEDIHYFSAVARHNARKSSSLVELMDVVASAYGVRRSHSRRLYVRRGPEEHRRLTNAAAVEAAFERHGYEGVFPADLPLEGQIHLFASASHVAGPLGAGLANIGFAPPECEVLMIDPGIGDYYFWDLSCVLQQRFTWLFAGPLRGHSPELAMADYAMDPAMLEACLAAM